MVRDAKLCPARLGIAQTNLELATGNHDCRQHDPPGGFDFLEHSARFSFGLVPGACAWHDLQSAGHNSGAGSRPASCSVNLGAAVPGVQPGGRCVNMVAPVSGCSIQYWRNER